MLSAYKTFTTSPQDKYYVIGYNSYLSGLPKDLADDLVLVDRARFLAGWDAAEKCALILNQNGTRLTLRG